MPAATARANELLLRDAPQIEPVEPRIAPRDARRSHARSAERTAVAVSVGATALLLGVLLVFTFQAASSYLPVFSSLVP